MHFTGIQSASNLNDDRYQFKELISILLGNNNDSEGK